MSTPKLTFFHAPQTRSGGTLALLEELGAEYELHLLNLKTGTQREPSYLAINPMGKVPAILHGDALVTEQPAVMMYLADLFPEKGLAPPNGDPRRGPYLRWLVFYGSCFEPALIDRSMNREPPPPARSAYGDYDTVIKTLANQLERGPYLLGDRFTAADVLWGIALEWTMSFKLVPELPVFRAYVDRVVSRPAIKKAQAKDVELAKAQEG